MLQKKIHDYRAQRIKDVPIQMKNTFLIIRKRRYVCDCGKRFYEKLDFLPRYHRMTSRLVCSIIKELEQNYSMKSVAKRLNVSTNTVQRVFDYVSYSLNNLPEAISIDEFKGNSDGVKYHCSIVDPINHKVLDIVKDRKFSCLSAYFKAFNNRDKVKYFICDMYRPFVDIAKTYFKNAKIVIDKYHFVRYNNWAIENVRKRVQKNMPIHLRKYYKRSRKLILARKDNLNEESKQQLEVKLLYSEDLRQVHYLKELFYKVTEAKSSNEARPLLKKWIDIAKSSGLKEYISIANTYSNWFNEILNSFDVTYTNGCTEGFNNKIKVLKRNAFGFRNFERFRNRILHCCR
ncbi:Transposase [Caloranaerobacter azorensis DSM 13643]|uniref:Transposase n=1 Tax=Caloranaerobacter azorensis DSM 13643 TaxID=1121264 RepID=A0A1M5RFN1_9FIRM|nr:ISL3 family transposase [Caloranaerobacter azorensis]SHH25084.1 Transposase [Caloranaerobacter azorensis DSM 13643]